MPSQFGTCDSFFFSDKLSGVKFWEFIVYKPENLIPLLSEQNSPKMNLIVCAHFCPPHVYLLLTSDVVGITSINNVMADCWDSRRGHCNTAGKGLDC